MIEVGTRVVYYPLLESINDELNGPYLGTVTHVDPDGLCTVALDCGSSGDYYGDELEEL